MKKAIFISLIAIFLLSIPSLYPSTEAGTPDPIIIIPGIMASFNADVLFGYLFTDNWGFTPTVDNYGVLIADLTKLGYVMDETLFVAHYDWRQRNQTSAEFDLLPIIDKALEHSSTGKVDIIAHSMGGLVARSYIQSDYYRNDIDQLFLLGVPNYGSADVYTLWHGGIVPDNWDKIQQIIINAYLWYMTETNQKPNAYETIRTYVPSIGQLLAVYPYIWDLEDHSFNWNALSENFFLDAFPILHPISGLSLNSVNGKQDLFSRVREIHFIGGENIPTVSTIPVISFEAETEEESIFWKWGFPSPMPPDPNSLSGDGRVTQLSATVLPIPSYPWWENVSIASTTRTLLDEAPHGDLPRLAIPTIFEKLAFQIPDGEVLPPEPPASILGFWFASPVEIAVIDPDGNIITKDKNEIGEAFYDGTTNPEGFKMVTIPNPKQGTYTVALRGIGEGGEYHMASAYFGEDDSIHTVSGTVTPAELIGYRVTLDQTIETPLSETSEPFIPEENIFEENRGIDVLAWIRQSIENVQSFFDAGLIKQNGVKQSLTSQLESSLRMATRAYEAPDMSWTDFVRGVFLQIVKFHVGHFIDDVERIKEQGKINDGAADELIQTANIILKNL